jgi:hypothetical protein
MSITLSHIGCWKNGTTYTYAKAPYGIVGYAVHAADKYVQVLKLDVLGCDVADFSIGIKLKYFSDNAGTDAAVATHTTAFIVSERQGYQNFLNVFGDNVSGIESSHKVQCTYSNSEGQNNLKATFTGVNLSANATYYVVLTPANTSYRGTSELLFESEDNEGINIIKYSSPFSLEYVYRYNWYVDPVDGKVQYTRLPTAQNNPRVLLGGSLVGNNVCYYSVAEKFTAPAGLTSFKVRTSTDPYSTSVPGDVNFSSDWVSAFLVKEANIIDSTDSDNLYTPYAFKFGDYLAANLTDGEYSASSIRHADCSAEQLWGNADMMLDITFDNLSLQTGDTYYLLIVPKNSSVQVGCIYYYCHPEDPADSTKYVYRQFVTSATFHEGATYTVTYNANGGSPTPSAQTKHSGVPIRLSSIEPSKDSEVYKLYDVTLEAKDGVFTHGDLTLHTTYMETTRGTHYLFDRWYPNAEGTGNISYGSADIYSADSDITLFANYLEKPFKDDTLNLPVPIKNGYNFLGWTLTDGSFEFVSNPYTPSGNVTLYAVYENCATGTAIIYRKVDNDWIKL